MSHAGPPRADDAPAVPEPTFAERARTLAYLGRTGTLATLSRRPPGHYAAVRPDPLADAAAGIVEHMNRDHADALVEYARHFAGEPADDATMVAVDRLGFKLRLRRGQRLSSARIAFPREVTTAAQSREVLIAMLQQARAGR